MFMAGTGIGGRGCSQGSSSPSGSTGCNPRKFSEKIALHTQRQAEDTAAFQEVMMDISSTKMQVQRARQARSLAPYYSGSLPNVNQMVRAAIDAQGQMACNLEQSCVVRRHLMSDHPHRERRLSPPGRPSRRHTDSAPYHSVHQSPPPPSSYWRRNWPASCGVERGQEVQLPATGPLNRTNSDSALHTTVRNTHIGDQMGSGQGLTPRNRRSAFPYPVPLIEENLPEENKPLKNKLSQVPSGSALANRATSASSQPAVPTPSQQGGNLLPLPSSLSMSGSLPDLSSLHLPSPQPTGLEMDPLGQGPCLASSSSSDHLPGARAHMHPNIKADEAYHLPGLSPMPAPLSNPLLQSSLSSPNIQSSLSNNSLPNSLSSTSLHLSLSNSSLKSSLSNQSLLSSLSSSSLSSQSLQSGASHCSYSSGIGGSRSCSSSSLSGSPRASNQSHPPTPHGGSSSRKRNQLSPLMLPTGGDSRWHHPKQFSPTMSPTLSSITQGVLLNTNQLSRDSRPPTYPYSQPLQHSGPPPPPPPGPPLPGPPLSQQPLQHHPPYPPPDTPQQQQQTLLSGDPSVPTSANLYQQPQQQQQQQGAQMMPNLQPPAPHQPPMQQHQHQHQQHNQNQQQQQNHHQQQQQQQQQQQPPAYPKPQVPQCHHPQTPTQQQPQPTQQQQQQQQQQSHLLKHLQAPSPPPPQLQLQLQHQPAYPHSQPGPHQLHSQPGPHQLQSHQQHQHQQQQQHQHPLQSRYHCEGSSRPLHHMGALPPPVPYGQHQPFTQQHQQQHQQHHQQHQQHQSQWPPPSLQPNHLAPPALPMHQQQQHPHPPQHQHQQQHPSWPGPNQNQNHSQNQHQTQHPHHPPPLPHHPTRQQQQQQMAAGLHGAPPAPFSTETRPPVPESSLRAGGTPMRLQAHHRRAKNQHLGDGVAGSGAAAGGGGGGVGGVGGGHLGGGGPQKNLAQGGGPAQTGPSAQGESALDSGLHNESYMGLHLTPSQTKALSQQLGHLCKESLPVAASEVDKEAASLQSLVPDQAAAIQGLAPDQDQKNGSGMCHSFSDAMLADAASWLDQEIAGFPANMLDLDEEAFELGLLRDEEFTSEPTATDGAFYNPN
ncbi:trithorax group protein osa [Engraulis encrasicolus]|uniref:trithorax group protein osa n=1 Tax=Engraulis encrasicolus TaxID=184585 RepID=UPI002FD4218C